MTTQINLSAIQPDITKILEDGDNVYLKIQALYAEKFGHIPSVGIIHKYLKSFGLTRKNKEYKQRDTEGSFLQKTPSGKAYRVVQIAKCKWEFEHVVIAKAVSIFFDGCVIHHKNGDTLNNNPSNLQALTRSEHGRLHGRERALDPAWREDMSKKLKAYWAKRHLAERVAEINGAA